MLVHRDFYFSLFLRMLERGAHDMKLAYEKPLLAFRDAFEFFMVGIAFRTLHG